MARYNDLPNEVIDIIIDFLISTGGRSTRRGLRGLVLADKRQYYGFLPRLYKLNARLLRPFKLRTFHTKGDFHARQADLLSKGSQKVNRALCWAIVHEEVSTLSRVISLTPASCRLCDVQHALKLGRVEMAKQLLDVGIVWERLLQWNRAMRTEIEARPQVRIVAHGHPLWLAVELGNVELVKRFLQDAHTPATFLDRAPKEEEYTITDDTWTPLHIACKLGHLEIVRLLLSHEADVECRPHPPIPEHLPVPITPTGLAIYGGHEEIVDELARAKPAVLTSKDNLAIAALRPSRVMVRKCLEAGATPSVQGDFHGLVPLHAAVVGGDNSIVEEFLKLGSNGYQSGTMTTHAKKIQSDSLAFTSVYHARPLNLAANASPKADLDLIRLLLEHCPHEGIFSPTWDDDEEKGFEYLVHARIIADDIACVEVLLKHSKFKPNPQFLGYAASPEMLQLLLRYGGDVNAEDERNCSSLHLMAKELVCRRSRTTTTAAMEAFTMLIRKSRNVNAKEGDGLTALHICSTGMEETVHNYLYPTIEDRRAYEERAALYVKMLLGLGARPVISSTFGKTALHGAIRRRHWKTAKLLIQVGPGAVNMKDDWGETPLHALFGRYILPPHGLHTAAHHQRAAGTGQVMDIMRLLVERGADPNLPDGSGFAPLFRALTQRSRKVMSCLIGLGAKPNARDRSLDTVLIRAAQVCSVEIVRLLALKGARVNTRGSSGETALIAAAARGRRDVCQALLSLGANPGIQDFHGKTGMDHIGRFERFKNEMAHMLLHRGVPLPVGFVLAPLAENPRRKRKRKRTVSLDTDDSQD